MDFPGGQWLGIHLPASAGDTGSIPGPGKSHMPQNSQAQELQLLSLCSTTAEAHEPRACAPQGEKPPLWEALAPQLESGPHLKQLEKAQ